MLCVRTLGSQENRDMVSELKQRTFQHEEMKQLVKYYLILCTMISTCANRCFVEFVFLLLKVPRFLFHRLVLPQHRSTLLCGPPSREKYFIRKLLWRSKRHFCL